MRIIYIALSAFFALLIIIAYYNFRRKRIGLQAFAVWVFALCSLSVFSLFPELGDIVIRAFGMKLRANFFLVSLMFITFAFILTQFSTNSVQRRELNRLTQLMAIQRFYVNSGVGKVSDEKGRSNILVKMAAYNEEKNIRGVLERMPDDVDVLVIDDGSMDRTAEVAAELGAMVIRHETNMGQGMGDVTGFMATFELGYDIVVEMDADGQHDPLEIPIFVGTLEENPDLDIVVGSRIIGRQDGNICHLRKSFLPLYTHLINWASGYSLSDAMCGFKAYRASSLQKHPMLFSDLFETEYIAAELYIRFGRVGLKVGEIPVNVVARRHGKSRKGTFRYGFAVIWVVLRTLLAKRQFQGT